MARGPMQLHRLHQLKAGPDNAQLQCPLFIIIQGYGNGRELKAF